MVGRVRKDSGSPSEASSHRIGFIPIHFLSGKGLVVIGPDHGPRVDVEQGTALAWLALTIAHAPWTARTRPQGRTRVLAAVHPSGNGALLHRCSGTLEVRTRSSSCLSSRASHTYTYQQDTGKIHAIHAHTYISYLDIFWHILSGKILGLPS